MSRAIQIRVSESVVRTVHVEDGVQSPLEMLPILPAERMAELLASELEAIGFVRDGNTARRVDADGVEITVDLVAATITVKLGTQTRVEEAIELTTRGDSDHPEPTERRLREQAKEELEEQVARKTEALRRDVTARLERKLGDLRAELDGAVGKATVSALTERAAQLGQIENVVTDEAGNVTIKVKV